MAHVTRYLPAPAGRVVTASWARLDLPPRLGFTGVSSHTVTAVPVAQAVPIAQGNSRVFPVFADPKTAVAAFYVVGGENGPRTLVPPERSVWRYREGKWALVQHAVVENAVTLLGHGAVGLNGLLHLFGGRRGGTMGAAADENDEVYVLRDDAATGARWERLAVNGAKPVARSYHACAAHGSAMYVFGGCSGHDRLNDLWRFDTLTGEWTQLYGGAPDTKGDDAPVPCPRGGAGLFVPDADNVYVFCGFNGGELASCYRFDVAQRTWHALPGSPGARSVFALVNMGGRALIFGGERAPSTGGHADSGVMGDDLWLFDPRDNSWAPVQCDSEVRPSARGWCEMARLSATRVLLVGGLSSNNERLADAYVLTMHF